MNDRRDDSESGMGTTPSGPSFQSPDQGRRGGQPLGQGPLPSNSAENYRPPRSRLPILVTTAAVVLVALVVGVATLVANVNDQRVPAPSPSPTQQRASQAPSGNGIDFTSAEGSGRLEIVNHEWVDSGQQPPISGSYLRIELSLEAKSGQVSYDSAFFQAFDARGELFDSTQLGANEPYLTMGHLRPGENVHGFISFDMPRGDVTLLMSNENYESVTAIKIQD